MAAHEFGQRVDHDVGAMLNRLAQIRRGQSVVDNERHAGALAISATAAMSVMRPPGLAMDSMKMALVFGDRAFSIEFMSSASAQTTCQPKDLKEWLNWLMEPP